MGFIGKQPTSAPLTASDITDGIISNAKLGADSVNAAKISDDSISDEHLDITSITGHSEKTSLVDADKFLISDSAASGALKYVQNSNLAGGGGLTFIKREVLSSNGDFDIDNLFNTNFANYIVILEDFTATVDSAGLRMRFHDTSGIVSGAKYRYACRYFNEDGTSSSNTGVDQTQFQIATNSEEDATWIGYNGTLTFYKPRQNTSTRFSGHGSFIQNDKTDLTATYLAGHIDDEQEMRGLFFYYSSGGIRAGATVTSFGINES